MQDTLYTSKINVTGPPDFPSILKCHINLQESILTIRLSNISNVFSLYICQISQSDFAITKREQGIKVDFQSFTKKIISFFHKLNENMQINVSYEKNDQIIKLSFIENDSFRNITRLELMFYKPDESEFRKFLGESIKRYEVDNVKLIKENGVLKDKLKDNEKRFSEKIEYVEREMNEVSSKNEKLYRENCLLIDENEKIKMERKEKKENEKKVLELERKISEMDLDFEKMKIKEIKDEKNRRIIDELNCKIERMENDLNENLELNQNLKSEIRDLKQNLKEKDKKYDDIRGDIKKTKKEKEEKNRKMRDLENRLHEIEKECSEKNNSIKNFEKENIELKKKLENAQSVYNHFYTKKIEKPSPQKSDDTSLFSSIEPESPPHS
ncbi:Spindle assembly abnormal protein 6 [Gurleya vavrai]